MADNILKAIIKVEAPNINQVASTTSAAVTKVEQSFKTLENRSFTARFAVQNLGNTIRDIPFAAANPAILTTALDHVVASFSMLKAEAGSAKGALQLLGQQIMGGGGLLIGFNLLTTAVALFLPKLLESKEAAKETKDELKSVFEGVAKEATDVSLLVAVLKSETETRERKLAAIQELNKIAPETFSNLKLEGNAVTDLDSIYKGYLESLKTVIAVKIKQTQLEVLIEKLLHAQGTTLTEQEKRWKSLGETIVTILGNKVPKDAFNPYVNSLKTAREKSEKEIAGLEDDINKLVSSISELSKGVKVPPLHTDKTKIKTKEVEIVFDSSNTPTTVKPTFTVPNAVIKILSPEFNLIGSEQRLSDELNKKISPADISKKFIDLNDQLKKATSFDSFLKAGNNLDEFEKSIKAKQGSLGGITKEAAAAASAINDTLTPAFQNMFTAIQRGQSPLKAFFNSIVQSINQLISKLIAAAIQALALNLVTSGGAGSFGSLFNKFAGFRASGGGVASGRSYIVGERGPELFTPGVSGFITPNNQMSGGLAASAVRVYGELRGHGQEIIAVISNTNKLNGITFG